jgi:hypothetical protein
VEISFCLEPYSLVFFEFLLLFFQPFAFSPSFNLSLDVCALFSDCGC